MTRILLFTFALGLIGFFHGTYAASDEKSAGVGAHQHTEHPPHDHHHDDHVKKLDESLRRSREEDNYSEEDPDEDISV